MVISPCPFKRGSTGAEVPLHNRTISNFVVYKDRLETNLLQLYSRNQKNSESFSIIFPIDYF